MTSDYISRADAIRAIMGQPPDAHYPSWYASQIEDVPAADVIPVVHGEWEERKVIHESSIEEWQSARCSVCGKYHTTPYMYYFDIFKFCPNCGANMRDKQDD